MGKIKYPKLWTSTKHRTTVQNAFKHYKDHGKDFPELNNAVEYVEKAHAFGLKPPQGTLSKIRAHNGDRLLYHPDTNTFVSISKEGVPRTMFKPVDGIKYFEGQ